MRLATLRILRGERAGERVPLERERFVLGRSRQVTDLTIRDERVGRQHCLIERRADGHWLVAFHAALAPLVNGRRVDQDASALLHHGDVIEIGEASFAFEEIA